MRAWAFGAWAGAVLALLLSIAYDTSSNVSVLEGARSGHLRFGAIVTFTIVLALVGAGVAERLARRDK